MKRYFIAAIFVGFIVLAIGLYLGLAAASPLPSFRIETLEGDSEEGKALRLMGIFENGPYNETVEITAEGSKYAVERSVYERFRYSLTPDIPELERLIAAYPGFMRGKYFSSANYYQDEEWLVRLRVQDTYAGSGIKEGRYKFMVDMLDKKNGQKRSLAAEVPDRLDIRKVMDIQKLGDTLAVALLAYPFQQSGFHDIAELRIYHVSLENGQISDGEKLDFGLNLQANQDIRLYEVSVPDSTASQKYLLLEATLLETEPMPAGNASNNVRLERTIPTREHRIFIYEYETGKMNTLTLPSVSPEFDGNIQFYGDDGGIVRLMMTGEEIHLSRYRLPDLRPDNEIQLTAADLKAESLEKTAWGKDRLYILHTARGLPAVTALELSSGNVVYRGAVTAAKAASANPENLRISYMTVRP